MDEMQTNSLDEKFEEIFTTFLSNSSRDSGPGERNVENIISELEKCKKEKTVQERVSPFLKYLDKKILYFIYHSDTTIDKVQDPEEAIGLLDTIVEKCKADFSPETTLLLRKIYDAEYKLIKQEIISDVDKLYFRSKSWLWSAVACLNKDGIEYFKNNYSNWQEMIVKCSLTMMILDDVIDLEEDRRDKQPNSILLVGDRVLDLLGIDWISQQLQPLGIETISTGTCSRLLEVSREDGLLNKEICLIFETLKRYVIGTREDGS